MSQPKNSLDNRMSDWDNKNQLKLNLEETADNLQVL